MLSDFMVAIDFGTISPKIKIRIVKIPVAKPVIILAMLENPSFSAIRMAKVVVKDEAVRLTILFPIRMELNNVVGSSINFRTSPAFFTFSSAIDFIRILFTVVRHVSAEEKNAERTNRTNKIIILEASLESKKSTPIN